MNPRQADYQVARQVYQQRCAELASSARVNWWRGWDADPTAHSAKAAEVGAAETALALAALAEALERAETLTGSARMEAVADATIAESWATRFRAEGTLQMISRWKKLYRDQVLARSDWTPFRP